VLEILVKHSNEGGRPGDFIRQTLDRVQVGQQTTFEKLTVFPLVSSGSVEPGYLTLGEALSAGVVQVTELSQGGSVPELSVINKADRPVFLLDGEELVGAKQNRVVNLSILVPAKRTLTIPVSCVEMGRWYYRTPEFSDSPQAMHATGRARKVDQVTGMLHRIGARAADQADVWEGVAEQAMLMGVAPPTLAMSDVYAHHARPINEYVAAFSAADDQVGALFAIGPRVYGFDLFDSASTLRAYLGKLVRSYVLDALSVADAADGLPDALEVEGLLEATAHAAVEIYPALGLGADVRVRERGVVGASLVWEDRVVHLNAFTDATAHRAPRSRRDDS
jgi:hypothetical protein